MGRVRKLLRYATVSVISTTVSLTVLGALVATGSMPAGWANVVATAVGTVPSFELNRRWVWGKSGRRSLGAEVLPFCVLSFAGLGLSTVAVSGAAVWATHAGVSTATRTLVVELANVAAFGSLWVAQFVVLDRLLFRHRSATDGSGVTALCVEAGQSRIDHGAGSGRWRGLRAADRGTGCR